MNATTPALFIPLPEFLRRALHDPLTLPPSLNIVVLAEADTPPSRTREDLLDAIYTHAPQHAHVSALYLSPTLDQARTRALADGWTPAVATPAQRR